MICPSCQEPHHPHDCIDNAVEPAREGLARWCYCQHKPRSDGRSPSGRDGLALGEEPAAHLTDEGGNT